MYYIAPEQVKGETALDARTDVYSLGMVLYEALTGQKVFDSPSQFEVMQAHVRRMPTPPREIRPGLSPDLNHAVLTAVAKERDRRFESARQFRDVLKRVSSAGDSRSPEVTAAVAAAPGAGFGSPPAETPLSDEIVSTWLSEKPSESAPSGAVTTAPPPEDAAVSRTPFHDILFDGDDLDPRIVGVITFVVTLIVCLALITVLR